MEWQFPSSGVVSAGLLLFTFLLLQICKKPKTNHDSGRNPPPGPKALRVIGNLHQLGGGPSLLVRLKELAGRYGPIMLLQVGEVPTVIISSPELAQEVMKTHESYFDERPPFFAGNVYFYGNRDLIFAPYGDYWKQLRKIVTMEVLSPVRVRTFRATREEEVAGLIRTISSRRGSAINLSQVLFSFTYSIISRISVGRNSKNQKEFATIVKDFSTISRELSLAAGGANVVDLYPSQKLLHMFSWRKFRLGREHKKADKILEKMMKERRASKRDKKIAENEVDDLLDVLLNLQLGGGFNPHLTDECVKAILLDMFAGGGDTTLTVLEWAMSELMKIQESGKKHRKKECKVNCKVTGYDLEAKTRVLINAWMIGRDPKYWTEPEKFYPERFLDRSTDYKGTNFEFLPFGSGKRICPGMAFGVATVELPLAKLLLHFDWEIPDGIKPEDFDMSEIVSASVTRKNDIVLIPATCYPPVKV
ncbi:CYTOCHROME P450 71B11-RELATED [Salix viminalis]|uniref:CYTOCHROME P450 71B11-RELATED n=1 Tax=Salix viminalis TaxID=40686 RepID=A0A9Q0NWS4_SALVM|nr:CYTOCHROME P450 71B11-RELATED [Salix viminalis]